jgi:hypothetical protein
VHRGDLEDIASLRSGAVAADGIIHTGFNHDFSRFRENCETDRRAVEALGSALLGTDRPLIVTSGTGLLTPGRVATEEDVPAPTSSNPRVASQEAAAALKALGVRVSLMRLPRLSTEMVITGSFRSSWGSRVRRASLPISAKG